MIRTFTICLLASVLSCSQILAQTPVQTVRGVVTERETQVPLPGANIVILNSNPALATISDNDGNFKIENVPVGRYDIQISFVGYEPYIVPEILVNSAKEILINASLAESVVNLKAVEIHANIKKDQPLNTMAIISARKMNMEEAHRYAGGFDDPARLASSFAGVATGHMDDNSISVRGNAPKSLLWRLEGVEIPNPNHFADMTSIGGGGITVFSSQMLTNSDFYTGAFPAEFGNVLSGVFDMKLRSGNNEQYEHAFQIGALGVDFSSEGPFIQGRNASYLFNYRYSTFALIMPVLPEGTNLPFYQDLCFKLNFPTEKAGTFSVWGIGGIDKIKGEPDEDTLTWETREDQEIMEGRINMGAIGLNHRQTLGKKAFIESILSASASETGYEENLLATNLVTEYPMEHIQTANWRYAFTSKLNYKFSAKHSNRTGFIINRLMYNTNLKYSNLVSEPLITVVDDKGSSGLYQIFSQSRMELVPGLVINLGAHLQYVSISREFVPEPRVGISYQLPSAWVLSIGYGKHSQLEPLAIYLAEIQTNSGYEQLNKDLRITKSHHLVAGIDHSFSRYLRLKIEPYFQYLYDVPVINDSSYSTINIENDIFMVHELSNRGTGINYGIDITLERFLNKGYYYLFSASLFDSKYKGGDKVIRNTLYNRNYVIKLLFGKEWQTRKNNIFSINGRLNYLGGSRMAPIDYESSINSQELIYDYSRIYEKRKPDVFQLDLTVSYKINKKNHSSSWALQVLNVLGHKENYGYIYNFKTGNVENDEVVVVVPSISYKIDF